MKMKRRTFIIGLAVFLLSALMLFSRSSFAADGESKVHYTREGVLVDSQKYPGVYELQAKKGDKDGTLGIPSIAKQNLENGPTTESPAIIMGAAVPYEVKVGYTEFKVIEGGSLYAPYSYFRYQIIEEPNQNDPLGGTHKKMSGFDSSYVIMRVDVSDLIKDAPDGSFLHVKQSGNKALMVVLGHSTSPGVNTFSDAGGNKVGCYSLSQNAVALKDKDGTLRDKPYIDVVIFSSGTGVAGADTGSTDPNVIGADFKISFYVDQTEDYNPSLVDYDAMSKAQSGQTTTSPTLNEQWLAKFYDESKVGKGEITNYTVKGSDLELEITNKKGAKPEFWSLRKALEWPDYNGSPVSLICEVPILEGFVVDEIAGTENHHVILDVNSFDIQIANNLKTGSAGLTVSNNAILEIMDGFNTTGAELAVGNNASMLIRRGGKLIVTDTCQLEVEYDAASTTPAEPGTEPATPTTPKQELNCGVFVIEDGGEVVNNGIITVEGTEGKPIDPANPAIRDVKNAEFHIRKGGKLVNNGCLLSYGALYNKGTIENNGRYADVIQSRDPDKGSFTYHKGVQISWKDDVTQDHVTMGRLNNGEKDSQTNSEAKIVNSGDIVLVPGVLENYGSVENLAGGNIYACSVDEAVIPKTPTIDQPLVSEKRIKFGNPIPSFVTNETGAVLSNKGNIASSKVEIVSNGRTGDLTELSTEDPASLNLRLYSSGSLDNSGRISLEAVSDYGTMENTGTVLGDVILCASDKQQGSLTDKAENKLDRVFNGALTEEGSENKWTYTGCRSLTVTPALQNGMAGDVVRWTFKAEASGEGSQIRYLVQGITNHNGNDAGAVILEPGIETEVTSSPLPEKEGNTIFTFIVDDGTAARTVQATVNVETTALTPPAAISGLIYNGKPQALVTEGGCTASEGEMEYRMDLDGAVWGKTIPEAVNAGTYKVQYRTTGGEKKEGTIEVAIGKKPVYVSAYDIATPVGEDIKTPSGTVSGLVGTESMNGISFTTNADKNAAGKYVITAAVDTDADPHAKQNYSVVLNNGTYTVTDAQLSMTASDKGGMFSDEKTYKGFNIDIKASEGAKIYYSTVRALTKDNFKTDGVATLNNLPAGAGVHTVYYFVANVAETDGVGGSKQVVIEKAEQKAPENLTATAETWKDSGDGALSGLTPREMEYRRKGGNGIYSIAYYDKVFVTPGNWMVRRMADDNHFASPDVTLSVNQGPTITVKYDTDGGNKIEDATGLACGDLAPCPRDPVKLGCDFAGWYEEGELYDFSRPLIGDLVLKAHWQVHVNVKGVSLSLSENKLTVGSTFTLTPVFTPSNATNKNVTWSSSVRGVATVSENGLVTAINAGNTVITVKTEEGGFEATCKVQVLNKHTPVGPDDTEEEFTMIPGEIKSLCLDNEDGYYFGVGWSVTTDNPKGTIKMKDGVVTAKKAGYAEVTAEYNYNKTVFKITVEKDPEPVTIPDGKKTQKLTATKKVNDTALSKADNSAITKKKKATVSIPAYFRGAGWTLDCESLDTEVCEISEPTKDTKGAKAAVEITPKDCGATYIKWTMTDESGKEATAYTKVIVKKPVYDLDVAQGTEMTMDVGEGEWIEAAGTESTTAAKKLSFSVKGKGVRVSKSGYVYAEKPTEAGKEPVITIKCGKVKKTITVKVNPHTPLFALNKTSANMKRPKAGAKKDASLTLKVSVPKKKDNPPTAINWSVEGVPDDSISVSKDGVVTVKSSASPGCYVVTATPADNSGFNEARCEIIVR